MKKIQLLIAGSLGLLSSSLPRPTKKVMLIRDDIYSHKERMNLEELDIERQDSGDLERLAKAQAKRARKALARLSRPVLVKESQ